MDYLPSKKVAIFVAVLIILVMGILWYSGRPTGRQENNSNDQTANNASSTSSNLFATSTPEQLEKNIESLVIPQIASGAKPAPFDINKYFKVYTVANLKTNKANNTETLHAYGLEIASALKPYSIARENEVKTFLRAIDNKQQADVDSLVNSREMKETVLASLLLIRVPTEAINIHLSLINSISRQIGILKNMEKVFSNPILALQSASFFPSEAMRFYRIGDSVNEFFARKQVVFGETERVQVISDTNF